MAKSILEVRGIGLATAALLAEHGIQSADDLAAREISHLAIIKGFNDIRAAQVIADAQALLTDGEAAQPEASTEVKAKKAAAVPKKKAKKGTSKKEKEKADKKKDDKAAKDEKSKDKKVKKKADKKKKK